MLLQKIDLLSSFCNNFSQPSTTWFEARQISLVHGEMRRALYLAVIYALMAIHATEKIETTTVVDVN